MGGEWLWRRWENFPSYLCHWGCVRQPWKPLLQGLLKHYLCYRGRHSYLQRVFWGLTDECNGINMIPSRFHSVYKTGSMWLCPFNEWGNWITECLPDLADFRWSESTKMLGLEPMLVWSCSPINVLMAEEQEVKSKAHSHRCICAVATRRELLFPEWDWLALTLVWYSQAAWLMLMLTFQQLRSNVKSSDRSENINGLLGYFYEFWAFPTHWQ